VLWDPQRIADDLAMNMARTVHWQEAMIAADERDAGWQSRCRPAGCSPA
jgi:malonate decarboxylase epsilon subunit